MKTLIKKLFRKKQNPNQGVIRHKLIFSDPNHLIISTGNHCKTIRI